MAIAHVYQGSGRAIVHVYQGSGRVIVQVPRAVAGQQYTSTREVARQFVAHAR